MTYRIVVVWIEYLEDNCHNFEYKKMIDYVSLKFVERSNDFYTMNYWELAQIFSN